MFFRVEVNYLRSPMIYDIPFFIPTFTYSRPEDEVEIREVTIKS